MIEHRWRESFLDTYLPFIFIKVFLLLNWKNIKLFTLDSRLKYDIVIVIQMGNTRRQIKENELRRSPSWWGWQCCNSTFNLVSSCLFLQWTQVSIVTFFCMKNYGNTLVSMVMFLFFCTYLSSKCRKPTTFSSLLTLNNWSQSWFIFYIRMS